MIRKKWVRVFAQKIRPTKKPQRESGRSGSHRADRHGRDATSPHPGIWCYPRPGHTRKFSPPRGSRTLVVGPENRYIGVNLQFSYEQRLRVGPWGPALFYYLEAARQPNARTRLLR